MRPEDGTYTNGYVTNIDEYRSSFHIVNDTVKLEVPFLSQQLGIARIDCPKKPPQLNFSFSGNFQPQTKDLGDATASDF